MPVYFVSLLRILRVVRLKLEQIKRDFLWGREALERKSRLVKWATIHSNKMKGCLGVKCLFTLNRTLFYKWNWRFAVERETLWKQVINRKFGEEEGGDILEI